MSKLVKSTCLCCETEMKSTRLVVAFEPQLCPSCNKVAIEWAAQRMKAEYTGLPGGLEL